jgi:hypothetical protein
MKKMRVQRPMAGVKLLALAALLAGSLLSPACLAAEAGIVFFGSTGLSLDGLKGWLGDKHTEDRIVVRTDESPIHLLFLWDAADLQPRLSISDAKGARIADLDLTKGNRVTLNARGEFVCVISRTKGSGHWLCVVLGAREWDAR